MAFLNSSSYTVTLLLLQQFGLTINSKNHNSSWQPWFKMKDRKDFFLSPPRFNFFYELGTRSNYDNLIFVDMRAFCNVQF